MPAELSHGPATGHCRHQLITSASCTGRFCMQHNIFRADDMGNDACRPLESRLGQQAKNLIEKRLFTRPQLHRWRTSYEMVQHVLPLGLLSPPPPPPPPPPPRSEGPFRRGSFLRMSVSVSTISVNWGRFSGLACQHASISSVTACGAQRKQGSAVQLCLVVGAIRARRQQRPDRAGPECFEICHSLLCLSMLG